VAVANKGGWRPFAALCTDVGYLKATLEAIAAGHPAAKIDELMPWNFQKAT
jgi:transposase